MASGIRPDTVRPSRTTWVAAAAASLVSFQTLAVTTVLVTATPPIPAGISTKAATAVAMSVTRPRRDLAHIRDTCRDYSRQT
ncbi:hypothetical protein GCM10010404_57460 [Nonomuraea africana]